MAHAGEGGDVGGAAGAEEGDDDGEADGGGNGTGDDAAGLGSDSHCSSPTNAHELPLYTQRPYPPDVPRWANAAPQRASSPL